MEFGIVNAVYDFCIMSALIFVAKIIRTKVKLVQKLYIPTALIAGFLGLFLGKQFLGVIPFSAEVSNYPGILIAVLFGSMFLGNKGKKSFKNMMNNVGDTFLVNAASEIAQFGFFIVLGAAALPYLFKGLDDAFSLLLPAGFVGGHGTAAAIGGVFAENGWEEATSIGQTFATIGLLGGIILGVVMINIAARKGWTKQIKSIQNVPDEMMSGLVPEEKRTSLGENTVNAMSLDTLSWHLTLVLVALGGAYLVNMGIKEIFPQLSIPLYGLALLCSIVVQWILKLFRMDRYVDKKIVTHIGSTATDYLVGFGVASINVSVVMKYALPIILMAFIGFVFVITWLFVISPKFFRSYWFERGIYIFGMSTGVLATGVILLRVADPEFETGVLEDFGFAWIFLSIMDMLLVTFSPLLVLNGSGLIYGIGLIACAAICLILCHCLFKSKKRAVR